ncbi:MAG: LacI family DNA-binding transcriptional regulator [bacterium]
MAITIDDIARETGYHRTTVSKILAGDKRCYASAKTRELIMETAKRLNFVPNYFARSLQMRRSYAVGVVGRLEASGVTGAMFRAIVEGLRAKSYLPLFYECSALRQDEDRALQEMRQRMVDGIILEVYSDIEALKRVLTGDIPLVTILNSNTSTLPSVVSDRFEAFSTGTQWLVDRGHKRIAFMGVGMVEAMLSSFNVTRLKFEGYRSVLERHGLHDVTLVCDGGPQSGDTREFVRAHGELFKSVTAVMACSDRVAIEVMTGLAEMGIRVPNDCSVIGFDDTDFAVAVNPRLTTFNPRRAEVGARAVEMVLNLIEGKPVENVTIIPELIIRESAGPCRG